MHDRVWRFLVAAHSRKDWLLRSPPSSCSGRASLRSKDVTFTHRALLHLAAARRTYQSFAHPLFATVGAHIAADLDTHAHHVRGLSARCIEVDRQRATGSGGKPRGWLGRPSVADSTWRSAASPRTAAHVDWFVRALTYRYDSYSTLRWIILLVETPHEQSIAVDEASATHETLYVDRAKARHDFCSWSPAGLGAGWGDVTIPSRFQTMRVDTEVVPQK
jgi:hypothetical protein